MEPISDPIVVFLTGHLSFILIAGACLSLPVSLFTMWRYRRAVVRGMQKREAISDPQPEQGREKQSLSVSSELRLRVLNAHRPNNANRSGRTCMYQFKSGRRRSIMVNGFAGALFAAVMAACFLLSSHTAILPLRFILLFWSYLWPLTLVIGLMVGAHIRSTIRLWVGYFVVYVLIGGWALIRSPDLTVSQLAGLWWSTNFIPTALLLVLLLRRVRAVGPLVLAFMTVGLTGSVLVLGVGEQSGTFLRTIASFGFSLGLGANGVFFSIIMIGFGLFAVLGWVALIWIRKSYLAKQTNEQFLTSGALWLLFGVVYAINLVFEGVWWIMSGVVAFLAWLFATRLGFRFLKAAQHAEAMNVRLLLLRVFALGRRSERLFNDLSQRWRYIGNLQLIAGPDLATTTVEPHEFMAFVSGRLNRQFINTPAALDRRLADLDTRPDFDGRYRINDFFCHDDTWQSTLRRLVDTSKLVLMDLRGFSPQNAGCIFELNELVDTVPLQQVLLIMDNTTDSNFLRQTLQQAWQNQPVDSPNRKTGISEIRAFMLEEKDKHRMTHLMAELCSMAHTSNMQE